MSRVDVFVPCYNYGPFLRECVQSVTSQTGVDVRVLILDDASNDDTSNIGLELTQKDKRVEYRRHPKNIGHISTYNEGLAWASGDFTLLLSADDLLTKGALARAAEVMTAYPEVGLSFGGEIRTTDPNPNSFYQPKAFPFKVLKGPEFLELACKEADNIIPTSTAVVRTDTQHFLGFYRADLPHSGDLEMWLRFGVHGSVALLETKQAYYRLHGQNMSIQYAGIPDLVQRHRAFSLMLAELKDKNQKNDWLFEIYRKQMAWNFFWLGYKFFEKGNIKEFNLCLKMALETWPSCRYTIPWACLICKKIMGPKLWMRVKPFIRIN